MEVSINPNNSEHTYVGKVSTLGSSIKEQQDLSERLANSSTVDPKVYYKSTDHEYHIVSVLDLFSQADKDLKDRKKAICVIENISPEYIEALGNEWNLDPNFFVGHIKNPEKDTLWNHTYRWKWTPQSSIEEAASSTYTHLSGIFEYHDWENRHNSELTSSPNLLQRHCFEQGQGSIQSNTNVSYYRANESLYLFLVDAPFSLSGCSRKQSTDFRTQQRFRTTLRFKYSSNRGGVILPQLFSKQTYSLLECFKSMFQHEWHFSLLFDNISGVLPAHIMLYMLSSSLWETNFRYLDADIKRLSFNEIRYPNLEINSRLHDRREDLEQLKSYIIETKTYVFGNISEYFEKLPRYQERVHTRNRTSIQNLERILEDARRLDAFLMDTFQLLMSSISVEQAQRGTLLTQLAFIYVPLSFVTGIFGMNVKEINGSLASIWVCIVAMAIVVLCTFALFSLIKVFTRRKQRRRQSRQQEAVYS